MWWGSRPRRCLKIGPDQLVWAEVGRGWTGHRHDRCAVRPLETGLIRLSPTEPNVLEPSAVQDHIRSLVGPSARLRLVGRSVAPPVPLPIILLLPDVCVRTGVFELDRLPRRREERDALIRWRFGQDHLFPLAGARVCYQPLSGFGPTESTKHTHVLAAAIHEAVLEQYEGLCMASNLVPVEITTSTFQLCNLWLESRLAPSPRGTAKDVLWISLLDRTFSVLAFHRGHLAFTRSKLSSAGSWTEAAERLTAARIDWVVRESGVSLRLWRETAPDVTAPQLVLAVERHEPELQRALQNEFQSPVQLVDWALFRQLGWTKRMEELPLSAMPAVAGLC